MSSLTQNLRIAGRCFVQDHLPHEAALFDHVWIAFWETLDCQRIEELGACPHVSRDVSPVRVLGAVGSGQQELDTLFVLGAFVNTIIRALKDWPKGDITIDAIGDTLKQEFVHIDAPDHLRPILFEHGMGLLADLLDVERPEAEASTAIDDGRLWVEYCSRANSSEDGHVDRRYCDPVVVEREFREQHQNYDVFIDEMAPSIYLPDKGKKPLAWSKLGPRHRRLLGLIMKAFPARRPVTYADIFWQALGYSRGVNPTAHAKKINRTYSELNSRLLGIFKGIVKADRGMRQYVIEGGLAYCWIRSSKSTSRLFVASP